MILLYIFIRMSCGRMLEEDVYPLTVKEILKGKENPEQMYV